jgi:hypothetical protein
MMREEWTEEELEIAAQTLRDFLVRLSESSAAAWAEMLSLERLEPLVIYEIDTLTTREIIRESTRPTLLEIKLAAMRVARDLGPRDWPAPRSLIEALRAVRNERVLEWRREHPAPALPAVVTVELTPEQAARNKAEAQRAMAYLREKLGIQAEADAAGKAQRGSVRKAPEGDLAAADARRAELRAQAQRLAAVEEENKK